MPHHKQLPPLERARELLSYDAETGELRWLKRQGRQPAGSIAGTRKSRGDLVVTLDRCAYKAHRIAWLLANGSDPGPLQIDHVNGDQSDNRIENLRLATSSQNLCNKPSGGSNSGHKGVYRRPNGRFTASICLGRQRRYLGIFDTPQQAHQAYAAAAAELHGEFARVA